MIKNALQTKITNLKNSINSLEQLKISEQLIKKFTQLYQKNNIFNVELYKEICEKLNKEYDIEKINALIPLLDFNLDRNLFETQYTIAKKYFDSLYEDINLEYQKIISKISRIDNLSSELDECIKLYDYFEQNTGDEIVDSIILINIRTLLKDILNESELTKVIFDIVKNNSLKLQLLLEKSKEEYSDIKKISLEEQEKYNKLIEISSNNFKELPDNLKNIFNKIEPNMNPLDRFSLYSEIESLEDSIIVISNDIKYNILPLIDKYGFTNEIVAIVDEVIATYEYFLNSIIENKELEDLKYKQTEEEKQYESEIKGLLLEINEILLRPGLNLDSTSYEKLFFSFEKLKEHYIQYKELMEYNESHENIKNNFEILKQLYLSFPRYLLDKELTDDEKLEGLADDFYEKMPGSSKNVIMFLEDEETDIEKDILENKVFEDKNKIFKILLEHLGKISDETFIAAGNHNSKNLDYSDEFKKKYMPKSMRVGNYRLFFCRFSSNIGKFTKEYGDNPHIIFAVAFEYGAQDGFQKEKRYKKCLKYISKNAQTIDYIIELLNKDYDSLTEEEKSKLEFEISKILKEQKLKLGNLINKYQFEGGVKKI